MLECFEVMIDAGAEPEYVLQLPFDARKRSRLRAEAVCGESIGLFLPSGTVLRDGDQLKATSGAVVAVKAATEQVSEARTSDALLHARAAYHLGNRHVPLQIGNGWLCYQTDHVLDDMLRQLGLDVDSKLLPFHPEQGAYHGGGHHHAHDE